MSVERSSREHLHELSQGKRLCQMPGNNAFTSTEVTSHEWVSNRQWLCRCRRTKRQFNSGRPIVRRQLSRLQFLIVIIEPSTRQTGWKREY